MKGKKRPSLVLKGKKMHTEQKYVRLLLNLKSHLRLKRKSNLPKIYHKVIKYLYKKCKQNYKTWFKANKSKKAWCSLTNADTYFLTWDYVQFHRLNMHTDCSLNNFLIAPHFPLRKPRNYYADFRSSFVVWQL